MSYNRAPQRICKGLELHRKCGAVAFFGKNVNASLVQHENALDQGHADAVPGFTVRGTTVEQLKKIFLFCGVPANAFNPSNCPELAL